MAIKNPFNYGAYDPRMEGSPIGPRTLDPRTWEQPHQFVEHVQRLMQEQIRRISENEYKQNARIKEVEGKMAMLNGFYVWLMQAYPETIAQYKALMDLQESIARTTSQPEAEQAVNMGMNP